MKNILIIICSSLTLSLYAQDTISTNMVNQFTQRFSIENFELSGKGADILTEKFNESQFVLIGETHDNSEISIFTSSIIPILKSDGFNYFFTENGNSSLQKMIECANLDSNIEKNISDFYTREYKRLGNIPVPFFSGKEDADFLETALNNKMIFRGIDQEYFYSFPLLFDLLFDLSLKSLSIKNAHKIAIDYVLKEYEQDTIIKNYPICNNLLNAQEINNYFDLLDTTDVNTKNIINDIKVSWRLYELNRIDRQKSFIERGNLMNKKFVQFYNDIEQMNDNEAKILIKMGAMHTMRNKTPLGIYDIGETVKNIALKNSTRDLNLFFMFRYYIDNEEPLGYFDNSEGNSNWLMERRPFMEQGDVEKWTIIDLEKLDAYAQLQNVFVYEPLNRIINQHDFVIIPPASKDIEINYKKE